MRTTPVPFVIVNVAVPVCLVGSLWLKKSEGGVIVAAHCGSEGSTDGVGDGDGFGLLFPLLSPLPLLPSVPFPFPFGVGVGDGVGVGSG